MGIIEYNKYIDHTFLKPEAKKSDIDKLIFEAIKYKFATVCVNPSWVKYVSDKLRDYHEIKVTAVIGFPLGQNTTLNKVHEAKNAISDGADELDMVINVGKLKDNDLNYVLEEINMIKKSIGSNHLLKVIVETALLSKKEIEIVSKLVDESDAEYIKTSTGFSTRGATVEDIVIMRKNIKGKTLIKAAGGVKTRDDLKKMIDSGASRIGTSRGVDLILDKKNKEDNY